MALPAQIENDLRELEALEKQLAAPEEDREDTAETPDVETEGADDAPREAAAPVEQPDSQAEARPQGDGFEQKYLSLKGKYDAEVPRLHQQVRELQEQLTALTAKAEAAAQEPPPEPKTYVTDEEKETFGEDLLDVQRRIAMEVADRYEERLRGMAETIEQLQTQLRETGGQVGQMSFQQRLQQLVPDFGEVNADPRWVEWLDTVDPMVRGPRRELAQRAFDAGDAEAIADYVRLFRAQLPAAPQADPQSDRKAELERQVTPHRSATATQAPTTTPGKRIYSEAQADTLWEKARRLSAAQQFDAAAKIEAELSAAYVEGRVRPGR